MMSTSVPRPFEIPELLAQILSHVEDIRSSALLVNREWAEICLDSLWYNIDDRRLAFVLLAPAFEVEDKPYAYMSSETSSLDQLRRFEKIYAHRIRVFSATSHLKSHILDSIILMKPATPLLPNLVSLDWSSFTENIMASHAAYENLLIHDNITTFKIRSNWSWRTHWDNPHRLAFIDCISKRMPNLDMLTVDLEVDPNFEETLLDLIRSLPRLRSVHLPAYSDPVSMLSEIQNRNLVEIHFSKKSKLNHPQPVSEPTLSSISPHAFGKLEALSLNCGFDRASLLLQHLFCHDPLRLSNLAVESGFEDTPSEVQKLCETVSRVGRRLKKLRLVGRRYHSPIDHDASFIRSGPPRTIIRFQDIKCILECSDLETFELAYPLDLPREEHDSISLAWPKLTTGEVYIFHSINTQDIKSIQVRTWRHQVQKAFLSSTSISASYSKTDMLLLHDTFNSISAFPMTRVLLKYSKIGKVMRHVSQLKDGAILLDEEFEFRKRAKCLVDQWQMIIPLNPTGLKINFRCNF